MKQKLIPTGNEKISLPEIREADGAILSINILHMGFKGLVEMRGADRQGGELLRPFLRVEGKGVPLCDLEWDLEHYWIPRFRGTCGDIAVSGIILVPVGERGFVYRLEIANKGDQTISLSAGLAGCWGVSLHTINESKEMSGSRFIYESSWNQSFVMDFRNAVTLFALAPIYEGNTVREEYQGRGEEIHFRLTDHLLLAPGGTSKLEIYWGLGIEEVGSATAAKEMLRKGFEKLFDDTCRWLATRQRSCGNRDLDRIFHRNLFFNFFYASGVTLDTEEFVLVTSRSPRYYVSAAYWDRDSLLWSFPSILLTDGEYARNMLEYVFTRQMMNIGVHSRYIDGTLLEPGFELDELCAPVIALEGYLEHTADLSLLKESFIIKGLKKILQVLESKKHPQVHLYETFLQPTDDIVVYPYLTYDNVLVWKVLRCLAWMLEEAEGREFGERLMEQAARVEQAIWEHCVMDLEGKRIFAWSVDLEEHRNVYDEPPGSLQLLTWYGFCPEDHPVYRNTLAHIRRPQYTYSFHGCNIAEMGCAHAPHPWVLSIANSLLCGRTEVFMEMLPLLHMDNGIACESVDEHTGVCTTGEAFATCAGFLAYAIYQAFFKEK